MADAVLPVRMVDKPWGRDVLPAPFVAPPGRRIGEIWFEPPVALASLLVKYIFTSEKLSVQVHPSDAQTEAAGMGRQGKEECWLVLDAEPGARLGIGFEREMSAEAMRAAALDGSIEHLLRWHEVAAGDFFYIPANTVHAIGAGISLIEIQQNSDITYRLYDYGRPRELHLDAALTVARGQEFDPALHKRLARQGAAVLVDGPWFRLDRVAGQAGADVVARYAGEPVLVMPLAGDVGLGPVTGGAVTGGPAAGGSVTVAPGGCAIVSELAEIRFADAGICLIAQPCSG